MKLMTALHRGTDSYVTFHRTPRGGGFKNLFSIRASHLKAEVPARLPALKSDAFFSINGFWNYALKPGRPIVRFINGVPSRKADHLRYLNACYSDIDFYNTGLDYKGTFNTIRNLVAKHALPPPSFGLRSRGLWLFWLLRDEKQPALPPRYSANRHAYVQIQKKLHSLISQIGADAKARDAARVTRVPGSKNSKNKTNVQVLWPANGRSLVRYKLTELARFLKIGLPQRITPDRWKLIRRTWAAMLRRRLAYHKSRQTKPNRWKPVDEQRVEQFRTLEALRSGFYDGQRNDAAFIYARLLTTWGCSPKQIQSEVRCLGRSCTPPLTPREIAGAIKSGTKRMPGSITNKTIRERLDITETEHAELKKKFPRYAWKPASGLIEHSRRQARLEEMKGLIRNGPLPIRKTAALLTKRGYRVSRSQVARDYKILEKTW
jgi:hypothetical protein